MILLPPSLPPSGKYQTPLLIATLGSPANIVWIVDGVNYLAGWSTLAAQPANIVNTAVSPRRFTADNAANLNDLVIGRHTDRTNVLYCDGHVKTETLDTLAQKNAAGVLPLFTVQDD